jgi:hypothetical protein
MFERLLFEASRLEPGRARPLATLIFDKTPGNAFFTIQFLLNLAQEGSSLCGDVDLEYASRCGWPLSSAGCRLQRRRRWASSLVSREHS